MKPFRLSIVEVISLCILLVIATFATSRAIDNRRPAVILPVVHGAADEELAPLRQRYGPGNNSEHGEEWIVRDCFQDRRDGFFIDVGANHYRAFNNTYYLDVVLGWSGIAAEPQTQFAADYAHYRPRTRFRPFFVSDVPDAQATLYVLKGNPLVTSGERSFTAAHGADAREMTAATITLNDLLASEKIQTVDFLTMDIELWKPKALAGFDIERFHPALVCVEGHAEVRQQILDYFAHGYTVVGKYLRADDTNL